MKNKLTADERAAAFQLRRIPACSDLTTAKTAGYDPIRLRLVGPFIAAAIENAPDLVVRLARIGRFFNNPSIASVASA